MRASRTRNSECHARTGAWQCVVGVAVLSVCLAMSFAASAEEPVAAGTILPVIVNIYANSGADADSMANAVKKANEILKQADLRLQIVQVNGPTSCVGDDGDAKFEYHELQYDELDASMNWGLRELEDLANPGKGLKINCADEPWKGDPSVVGLSPHKIPVIWVKDRDDADKTGATIAHEVGHCMTLWVGHKIDATTEADDTGHAPDEAGNSGRDNLMASGAYRMDTYLTPDQIAEMKTRYKEHGKTAEQMIDSYPAEKADYQFGSNVDTQEPNRSGAGILDLERVAVSSRAQADTVDAEFIIAAVFPDTGTITGEYALAFDTDDDVMTGATYAGHAGMDRIVRVDVSGESGVFSASGAVENTVSGMSDSLPTSPCLFIESLFKDVLPGSGEAPATPWRTCLEFRIPKSLLGFSADMIPVVATAGNERALLDTLTLEFDLARWARDATLETFGTGIPTPGSAYDIAVTGLAPSSPLNVFLNDDLVISDVLDPTGFYAGSFIFPAELPVSEFHFLTAQDTTGEFAYNITSLDDHSGTDEGSLPPTLIEPSPNPFTGSTTVVFELPVGTRAARLAVYNAAGKLVKTLAYGRLEPGRQSAVWDGTDNTGHPAAAGVYFVKLEADRGHVTRKVVLIR